MTTACVCVLRRIDHRPVSAMSRQAITPGRSFARHRQDEGLEPVAQEQTVVFGLGAVGTHDAAARSTVDHLAAQVQADAVSLVPS